MALKDDYCKIFYFIFFQKCPGVVCGGPHINDCIVYKENIFLSEIQKV